MEETVQFVDGGQASSEKFSLRQYFHDARAEFGKIVWPERVEAIRLSAVILGITVGMALVVAFFDYVSAEIILVLDRVF